MKILIAVPCMDHVPTPFCQSLALIQKIGDCTLMMQSGSLVYASRDTLATLSVTKEFDYVLWLDSDMVFKPDTLIRMMDTLQKNDLDILTGLCFRRVPPYTPTLFDKLEMDGDKCIHTEFDEIPEELFEVGGCGFAAVLMKTDVFLDVSAKFGAMFTPIGSNGEDASFCMRARECGYKIYCDPKIVIGHVGNIVVDDVFYKATRR